MLILISKYSHKPVMEFKSRFGTVFTVAITYWTTCTLGITTKNIKIFWWSNQIIIKIKLKQYIIPDQKSITGSTCSMSDSKLSLLLSKLSIKSQLVLLNRLIKSFKLLTSFENKMHWLYFYHNRILLKIAI